MYVIIPNEMRKYVASIIGRVLSGLNKSPAIGKKTGVLWKIKASAMNILPILINFALFVFLFK